MYKNLVLYRNELKNKIIPNYKILGIVTEIVLSKELFKRNADLNIFLKEVFDITYKDYVMRSRTMILARTCRLIDLASEEKILEYRKQLTTFILEKIELLKELENSKKHEKNPFDGWVE